VNPEPGQYVLDSYAILAYLEAEAGVDQVRTILELAQQGRATLYLCVANYGEVVYITEREQGLFAAQRVIAALDQLPVSVVEADRKLTLAAAHVKAHHAISYADAFAVALAQGKQATVLTGDPEFRQVEKSVAIEWLPSPLAELQDTGQE
jgi:ribonuclease VapC